MNWFGVRVLTVEACRGNPMSYHELCSREDHRKFCGGNRSSRRSLSARALFQILDPGRNLTCQHPADSHNLAGKRGCQPGNLSGKDGKLFGPSRPLGHPLDVTRVEAGTVEGSTAALQTLEILD